MLRQISAGGLRFGINSTRLQMIKVTKAASNGVCGIDTVLNAILNAMFMRTLNVLVLEASMRRTTDDDNPLIN